MLYGVFAFWAGATIAIMGIDNTFELFKINQNPLQSPDGGPLCLPAHSPSSLGGVSVKILRRGGIQLCSIQFQVSGFTAFVMLKIS